jgi:hypothetical protein
MKKFKVRITQLPQARTGYQVQGSLVNDVPAMGGRDYNAYIGKKPKQDSKYLTAVPRDEANLEAEDGETAFGDINGDGFPEHKIIKGKRHYEGGVPLNLPDGTFIFSDTKSMKISDCTILKMFGKPCGKQSYTPAELAKPYDINKYRVLLEDADSDEMTRKTAEMMIKKYVIKLGALALAQESKKGFPQGIPEVARPYMEAVGLSEEDILPNDPNKRQQEEMSMANNIPQTPGGSQQPVEEMPQGSAPTQMPNGEPIAQPSMDQMPQGMPQGMSPEMMQQAPMAAFGMEMGGYGMPFYSNANQMAYGGLFKAQDGVIIKPYGQANTAQGNRTPMGTSNMFSALNVPLEQHLAQWEQYIPGVSQMSEGDAQKAMYEWSLKNNPDVIRNMWRTHGITNEGRKYQNLMGLTQDGSGKFSDDILADPNNLTALQQAYVDKKFGVRQLHPSMPEVVEVPQDPETPEQPEEPVTPPADVCHCPDPNDPNKQIEVECPEDGSEPICGDKPGDRQSQQMGYAQSTEPFWPEWRTQDRNLMMNTMLERHGKEYPIMPDLQMPEMQPVYKNWLGEVQADLAGQAGRTNEIRRSAGNSAGKQAILTQMQGQQERIIGNTNTDNVNIENQLDRATNFGVRDKNMTNRANANRQYMGELGKLNQDWNNEMNDWNYRKTLQQNQGLTNAANTYNSQTEQYAINPRGGMGVFKGGKLNKPEQQLSTLDKLMQYKQSGRYPGIDDATLLASIKADAGNAGFTPADLMYGMGYGGPVYANGGLVYADVAYPFIL